MHTVGSCWKSLKIQTIFNKPKAVLYFIQRVQVPSRAEVTPYAWLRGRLFRTVSPDELSGASWLLAITAVKEAKRSASWRILTACPENRGTETAYEVPIIVFVDFAYAKSYKTNIGIDVAGIDGRNMLLSRHAGQALGIPCQPRDGYGKESAEAIVPKEL